MSLSGETSDVAPWIEKGIDPYIGAPAVSDMQTLSKILATKRGFIIIDRQTRLRLPVPVRVITHYEHARKVFSLEESALNEIAVYEFGPNVQR